MPKPNLWSFVAVNDCLFIKNGGEIKHCLGPVIDVRSMKDKLDYIKVWYQ